MSEKSRLAGLILLSVTIVYVIAIYVSIQNYNAWREEKLLECPVEIRPYVDFDPFWATKLGSFMVLISFAIGFCWVLFVYAISKPAGERA